MLNSLAARNS